MGDHARGPMGLTAPRAWGPPQRPSSPRAGRRTGQAPLHQPPCAARRAPCAFKRASPGSAGSSAPASLRAAAQSPSAPETPLGRDSDSGDLGPWVSPAPSANDLAQDGTALLRPWQSMKQTLVERASRTRARRSVHLPPHSASDTEGPQSSHSCSLSLSRSPRLPRSSGDQGSGGGSLDREVCGGAHPQSWGEPGLKDPVDTPAATPGGTCSRAGSFCRRRWSLGALPKEGGWQAWGAELPSQTRGAPPRAPYRRWPEPAQKLQD